MKVIKTFLFTFIALALVNSFMVYAGPCAPLGRKALEEVKSKGSRKFSIYQPSIATISSSKTFLPKKRSYASSRKSFFAPSSEITALRNNHYQFQDDLNKLKRLLLKYEENQKKLLQLNEELKQLCKLKKPEKEEPVITTGKIYRYKQIEDLGKEFELK